MTTIQKTVSGCLFSFVICGSVLFSVARAESLGPISEETPPATCDPGAFIRDIRCTGRKCDNKTISCQRPSGLTTGRAVWTSWFSEEEGGAGRCPSGFAVAGLTCRGDFCDNISLYCVEVRDRNFDSCRATNEVSNEDSRPTTVFAHPNFDGAGQVFLANGLNCDGDHCDNISLNACEIF